MGAGDEQEQDAPQSIASLRSKFESLAADQKGLRDAVRPASPSPSHAPARTPPGIRPKPASSLSVRDGEKVAGYAGTALRGGAAGAAALSEPKNGNGPSAAGEAAGPEQSTRPSRVAGLTRAVPNVQGSEVNGGAGAGSAMGAVGAAAEDTGLQQPLPSHPTRSRSPAPPRPIKAAQPASTLHTGTQTPPTSIGVTAPSPRPLLHDRAGAGSGPGDVEKRAVTSVEGIAAAGHGDPDTDQEPGLSVAALKERFSGGGGGGVGSGSAATSRPGSRMGLAPTNKLNTEGVPRTQSPMSSRAPSPAPANQNNTSETRTTSVTDASSSRPAGLPVPTPPISRRQSPVPFSRPQSTSTLAHMTEREHLSVPTPTPMSSGTADRAGAESAGSTPVLGMSRSNSRDIIRDAGSGSVASGTGEGYKLSASPQVLSALASSEDGSSALAGPSAAAGVREGRPAPPPPPASRHTASFPPMGSAARLELDATDLQPHSVGSIAEHRRPPRPPASRSDAVQPSGPNIRQPVSGMRPAAASSASTSLSRSSTVRSTPSTPPTLPVRKMSLPPDGQSPTATAQPPALPPPIPANRPASAMPSTGPSKPTLPARPRGETVTAAIGTGSGPTVGPPVLPARSDTAPADLPPPPPPVRTAEANATAGPGAGLTRRITRKAVPTERTTSPRQSTLLPPARRGSVQVPPSDDGYQPPPPPTRSAAPVVAIPPRQNSKEADSDEDEPEEPVPGLTTNAKRLLDDYPDSTHANRRPPSFVPDIRISGTAHATAFAAHGRHVCIGTHCVKVYDTLMSDQPLFVVDLKETGLDFRVKENRVTAMCFRPANNAVDEGRYLWCGTKDGHLWELDIKTGDITDTRAFVHSSAVSHIFRYKSWIMSLEEGGKLHVFQVQENRRIPQCRTIRVQERFNFAKLIGGRLWTSTGPANRSTTNAAASRGPTIRVYDPCAPGTTLSAGITVWPSEWTGAVTSATCMPMHPGTVYLGHEGGYISVWDAEQLVCLQVFKISANDILALEGVGERLWAAGRKGMISVYDVSERPWRTTNVWTAHIEFAIHELVVDPYSVHDTGRFILWSLAKDGLRAWDGLLSVDWVDQQMTARQAQYCSFRQIKALICSWNIDSARPHDLGGSQENQQFFPQLFDTVDRPEILVFGFQEVIPLTDKKLTAKTLLFGNGKDKDSDKVSGAYRQWVDKLQMAVSAAYPGTPYVRVHSENMVGLLTCVFVKADERDILRDVDVCTVKRGIGGIYGNKGAIVARLVIDDTSICFINVHLAAGQSAKASRTADLAAIMEDKAVFPPSDALPYVRGGDGTAISDHELVILNGDLNYRIDQRRENVVASITAGDLDYLLEHDQLRKEMRNNHAFRLRSFDEAPITFEPTYKYNPGTDTYDTSEKNRIPAWCDRILHSKSDRIQSLHYRRYEANVSDHRPISAAYALKVKAVNWEKMKAVREEVRGEWAKREADVLERIENAYADLL